jgi:hypothetical protein
MAPKSPPYDIGDALILRGEFLNSNNQFDDPSAVTLEIACPDGTIISLNGGDVIKDDVGKYHYRYLVNNGIGYYYTTWRGSGIVDIVREKRFPVRKPLSRS